MPRDNLQTFECTICGQHHTLYPDTLPIGHSGHKPHCVFCLIHTVYRSIIPAAPTTRPTPEQNEKNNIIKTRKIVIFTITPVIILAYFAFRWQKHYWDRVTKSSSEGEEHLQDRLLWIMLCMVGFAPCGFVLGFLVSVAYYTYWCLKKRRAKRKKARQQAGAGAANADISNTVPLEERPLAELRYQDLRDMNEPIEIVVTPPNAPETPPMRKNTISKMLGVVTDRFRDGYDGRAIRRQSWVAMEELRGLGPPQDRPGTDRRTSRPTTEWPVM